MSGLTVLKSGVIFAGDYRIIRPLKEGGMGAVYVAEQLSTSAHRALKVIQPELVEDAVVRRRFEREARVGAQIRSDHVVTVIQAGFDDATRLPWLAMELLEGQDLEAAITERTFLPPEETMEIFEQLCEAVGAAHRVGIVHRDIKPENIFLANPRRLNDRVLVKVLDFGIARILAEIHTTSSKTRHVLGTPLYMAPEQARPGNSIDARADVWALGLVAFRMLTGNHFWRTAYDPNATLLMLAVEAYFEPLTAASARAAFWSSPQTLSPAFDAWFARCLSRDPIERFPNAERAFEALRPVLVQMSCRTDDTAHVPFAATLPQARPANPPRSDIDRLGGMLRLGDEVVAAAVAQVRDAHRTGMPPAPESSEQQPLEGVWVDVVDGTHLYAKSVHGRLHMPYCFRGNSTLTGVFSDWIKVGDLWHARFRWINGHRGFALLKFAAASLMYGTWWHSDGADSSGTATEPPKGRRTSICWKRVHPGTVPAWAIDYFSSLEG